MPTERELDEILDAALPGYSAIEPRAGLEQRILTNALAQQPRRKWHLWVWAFAIPAIASVLVLFWMTGQKSLTPQLSQPRAEVTPHVPVPQPTPETAQQRPLGKRSQSSRARHATPVIATAAQFPKQEIFPTPTPITPDEERMLAFTNSPVRPPAQSGDIAEIPPLHIVELNIKPLTMAETQTTTPKNGTPQTNQP